MSPSLNRQYVSRLRQTRSLRLFHLITRSIKVGLFAFTCLMGGHQRPAKSALKTEEAQVDDAVQKKPYGLVQICFATTRNQLEYRLDRNRSIAQFGSKRANELTFGCHVVSYPLDTPMGNLRIAPQDDHGLINLADRKDHYTIHSSEILTPSEFLGRVYQQIDNQNLIVDVHGYNTSHESAVLQAAQLWNASAKTDTIVVFDFASDGNGTGYVYDLDSVKHAQTHFVAFMATLGRIAGTIDIRAHSMGATLVLPGLALAYPQSSVRLPRIGNLLLAAPAMDADNFRSALQQLDGLISNVLVYCSPKDRALEAASLVHRIQLVGQCIADNSEAPTLFKTRLDIIDVTTLSICGFLDNFRNTLSCWHSWHRTSSHMLIDANLFFSGISSPMRRGGLFAKLWSWHNVTSWRARLVTE